MARSFLSGLIPAMGLLIPGIASAFEPVSPGNLNADVNGMVVNLSWSWGNEGEKVLSADFEWDELTNDNWEVKSTYNYDILGNWMLLSEEEAGMPVSHSGNCAALLIGTENEDNPADNHQDEWLIVRPGAGAVYMDFWYFIHPKLLEVGGFREFPDHYYVQVSYDNGKNWEELWDARWDMGMYEGVQQASLFLGDETDEDTLVAFHAVSGEEESLYFLWTVDDVDFYSAEEYAERKLSLNAPEKRRPAMKMPENITVKRDFIPSGFLTKENRISPSEWLNNGNYTFRVYLDGEMISDYLKARHITDYSTKEPGIHDYKVVVWSEAMDEEFDAATLGVEIGEVTFEAPRNVAASYEAQSNGKYVIEVTWEAPDGDTEPAYYNVLVNGKSIAWVETGDELAAGQSGIYKGAYTFAVEAIYQMPDGTSKPVCASVFPGTVPTVSNLSLSAENDGVKLSWEAPEADDLNGVTYEVYRGETLIADALESLSYFDAEPVEGRSLYSVHAVYGIEKSLPVSVAYGEFAPMKLPYVENFDNGHLPTNWDIELIDPNERVKDMYSWRLDNWFGINIPAESGIEGGFASTSGVAAGMNSLQTFIISPEFELAADGEPELSFVKYYYEEKPGPSGSAQFVLGICTAGGEWTDLENLQEMANGKCTISLAEYAGKTVRLRWGFLGRNSGEVAIDNISLTDIGTGVESIIMPTETVDVYSTSGLLMMSGVKSDALSNLPKGVYILKGTDGSSVKHLVR